VEINKHRIVLENKEGGDVAVKVYDEVYIVKAGTTVQLNNRNK
jgi:maltose phosphorylase